MFNCIKIFLYKFIPTFLYQQIMCFNKKYRLKKINRLLLKKNNYEIAINFLKKKLKIKNKIFIFGSGSSIKYRKRIIDLLKVKKKKTNFLNILS